MAPTPWEKGRFPSRYVELIEGGYERETETEDGDWSPLMAWSSAVDKGVGEPGRAAGGESRRLPLVFQMLHVKRISESGRELDTSSDSTQRLCPEVD